MASVIELLVFASVSMASLAQLAREVGGRVANGIS